jgi:hypothetical protein
MWSGRSTTGPHCCDRKRETVLFPRPITAKGSCSRKETEGVGAPPTTYALGRRDGDDIDVEEVDVNL